MPNQGVQSLREEDIDSLLASVERTLDQVPALAKSAGMQSQMHKADPDPSQDPEADAQAAAADAGAAQADAGAAQEAAAGGGEMPPSDNAEADAGSQDPGAAAAAPDAQIQAEAGSPDDAPLSDEELDQIYGAMDPDELMRHYSAIRAHLERHMGDQAGAGADQGAAPDQAPPDAAMAMAAKAEMEASGGSGSTIADINAAANKPKDEPSGGAGSPAGELARKSEVSALRAELAELKKAANLQLQAFEIFAQPSRKAITGVEYIKKNEELENPAGGKDFSSLSKAEIGAHFREIGPAKLSESERSTVNNYLLNNEGRENVLGILKSKEGK